MKRFLTIIALSALTAVCARAQKGPVFDDWFVDKTMRVDYVHAGNSVGPPTSLLSCRIRGSRSALRSKRKTGRTPLRPCSPR